MALQDLLSSAQGKPVTTTTPVVKSGGLSTLLATSTKSTPFQADPSIIENPQGSGYPALKPDGSPFTPVPQSAGSKVVQSVKNVGDSVQSYADNSNFQYKTESPSLSKGGAAFLDTVEKGSEDFYDRLHKAVDAWKDPKSTIVEKAGATATAGLGALNGLFAVPSAVIEGSTKTPGLRAAGQIVKNFFGIVSTGVSTGVSEAVDATPLSPRTKAAIKQPLQEIATIVALGKAGKLVGETYRTALSDAKVKVKEVVTHVVEDTKTSAKPTGLSNLLDQAKKHDGTPVVEQKVVDTAQVMKDAGVKTVGEKMTEAPKSTYDATELSSLAKNSLLNDATGKFDKPDRFTGEGYSYKEAETGLAENGVDTPGRIIIGKDGKGNTILKDGTHLLEAYRDKGLEIPRNKVVFEDGVTDIYKKSVARVLKPAESTGEKVVSKLASNVEDKAVEAKLTERFGDLPTHNKVNMKEQAELANKLLKEDPERAHRIAMGEELPPNNILPESVFTAVENKAFEAGDGATLRDLGTKSHLAGESVAMGQRIRALAERHPDSPVAKIGEVQKVRQKAVEKKLKGKTIKKAKAEEVEKIKKEIKKSVPTKQDWSSFIEEIKCNY